MSDNEATASTVELETENNATNPEHVEPSKNAEAAKFRKQAREAEAERDALAQRVQTMQRAEIERAAAAQLANGADLWLHAPDIDQFLDDAGNIDPQAITKAIGEIRETRPHWLSQGRDMSKIAFKSGGVAPRPAAAGWQGLLNGETG